MTRRKPWAALFALTAMVVVSACASPNSTANGGSGPATDLTVLPAGAQRAPATTTTVAGAQCEPGVDPKKSLPPLEPLPSPGHMPPGSYMATIQSRGYLIAGVDQNTLLWGYRDPSTGQYSGFDIDMVSEIAAAIFGNSWRAHIKFVVVPNADRFTPVEKGQVDVVAETITINCPREQKVDFSAEYYDAGQAILVPNMSPINSEKDLAGRRVCAAAGSTSLGNLSQLQRRLNLNPPMQLWSVSNQTDCLVMLQQGQVDAISTDDTILEGLAAQDPQVHLLLRPGSRPGQQSVLRISDEPYGMAISKKHPEFTEFVNAVLAREEQAKPGATSTWTAIWNDSLAGVLKTTAPAPPKPEYK
jgi:polar amino acid transport system substrate-binding protein